MASVSNSSDVFNPQWYDGVRIGKYVTPVTFANTVALGICFGVLFLVNATVNVLLLVVIQRSKKLTSKPINRILQSFLVSDIISAINSIPFWYKNTLGFEVYRLPDYVCRISWIVNHLTMYVTSLHILLLTLYRYYGIIHWKKASRITLEKIQKAIVVIWIISAVSALPVYKVMRSQKVDRTKKFHGACSGDPDVKRELKVTYMSIAYSLFFYFPFITICIATIRIIYSMFSRRNLEALKMLLREVQFNRRMNKNRIILRALLAVKGMYFVGFIPYTYGIFSAMAHRRDVEWAWMNYTLHTTGYVCTRISEALNPFVYIFTNGELKTEVYKTFVAPRNENRNPVGPQTVSSTKV